MRNDHLVDGTFLAVCHYTYNYLPRVYPITL